MNEVGHDLAEMIVFSSAVSEVITPRRTASRASSCGRTGARFVP
jgi:hypothetical protein